MNADMKWLDNPEVFKVNQLEPVSDHCYYLDYSDMKKEKNPLLQATWNLMREATNGVLQLHRLTL